MSSIEKLRSQIEAARERLGGMPPEGTTFTDDLSRGSLEYHIRDLESRVRRALEARRVEVLTLRLDGPGLRDGSIPLGLLAKVGDHLSSAIQAGVQRRRTGRHVARLSPKIRDLLDLRLAGISAGSTTLQITGATAPDLFGLSDLESVLEETFSLLEAQDREELSDSVSHVGVRTAREVSRLADLLAHETASLEVTWSPPSDELRTWSASAVELGRLASALGSYEEREPEDIHFSGTTVTLSLRGRFEIDLDGKMVSGSFPSNLQTEIRKLRIGEAVTGVIRRTRIVNTTTAREKTENVLVEIAAAGQEEL